MLIDVNVISKLIGLIKMLIFGRQSEIIALHIATEHVYTVYTMLWVVHCAVLYII